MVSAADHITYVFSDLKMTMTALLHHAFQRSVWLIVFYSAVLKFFVYYFVVLAFLNKFFVCNHGILLYA